MGDGGFIMQLTDLSTGEVVAVSNAEWACTVIHEAPLDKSCENEANPVAGVAPCEFIDLGEPDGWMMADYDDSAWTATTVHTAARCGSQSKAITISHGTVRPNSSGDQTSKQTTRFCVG